MASMAAEQEKMIKSKVTPVTPKSTSSFKTVIPQAVVQLLELKSGDFLDWKHEISGDLVIFKVKKAKS